MKTDIFQEILLIEFVSNQRLLPLCISVVASSPDIRFKICMNGIEFELVSIAFLQSLPNILPVVQLRYDSSNSSGGWTKKDKFKTTKSTAEMLQDERTYTNRSEIIKEFLGILTD